MFPRKKERNVHDFVNGSLYMYMKLKYCNFTWEKMWFDCLAMIYFLGKLCAFTRGKKIYF